MARSLGRALSAGALLLVGATSRPVAAQDSVQREPVPVAAGARVRITAPRIGRRVGDLVAVVGDTLVTRWPSGDSSRLSVVEVVRLETSEGRQRYTGRGAGIGLLAGAGVATVVGLVTYRRSECGDSFIGTEIVCPFLDRTSRSVSVVLDAAIFGTAGAIVGALVGYSGREAWMRVPLRRETRSVRLLLPASGARGGIGLAIAY